MINGKSKLFFMISVIVAVFSAAAVFAGTGPELNVLSPVRGEEIPFGNDLVIAVSIYDPDGDAVIQSIKFKVDGTEITQHARVSVFLATFAFEDTTAPGKHTFSLTIKDNEGNSTTVESFFSILPEPKKQRAFTAHGSIRAGGEYEKESDQNVVGLLDSYVYGRLTDIIDYSLNVNWTNAESIDGQRVSYYRLNLFTPIGGVVLGDTTPSFSSYSIDGTDVFGIHLLPQFGAFGMELLWGQALRDVNDPATFQQMVYGGKIKIGRREKFLWGLSFLKIKDKTDSLSTSVAGLGTTPPPRDNIILGTDFSLSLFDGVFELKVEANESWLAEDITTGTPYSYLEPYDWFIVVNNSMVPAYPQLTSLATKGTLKLGPIANNTFNGEFSYIGPAYNSLANTGLVNDRIGGRAWDSIWLLDERLFLSAGFQYYVNNLADTLTDTTRTIGTSVSSYVYPTDYLSIDAGFNLQSVSNSDDIDSRNTVINAGVTQNLAILITDTDVYFDGNVSLLRDNVDSANDANTYSTRLGAISYFTPFPLDTKIAVGYDFGDRTNSFYLEGRGGYRFFQNESLYTFTDVIYETGIETLDLTVGVSFDAPFNISFETDFEYITAPSGSDIIVSAFAMWEF
ncbi:MAG TPA: hypothetical protein ENI15_01680 [Spirochaetes bacterium]|nr:hypothetical protein [Spirochaetota bacterium]